MSLITKTTRDLNDAKRRGFTRAAFMAGLGGLTLVGLCSLFMTSNHATAQVANGGIAWTPEEIAVMQKATVLMAGKTVTLGIAPNNAAVSTGGTWKAQYGTITATGAYTAPTFAPMYGQDTVTYCMSNGDCENVIFKIIPNPAITDSDKTPIAYLPPDEAPIMPASPSAPGTGTGPGLGAVSQSAVVAEPVDDTPAPIPNNLLMGVEPSQGVEVPVSQAKVLLAAGQSLPPIPKTVGAWQMPVETAGNDTFQRLAMTDYPDVGSPIGVKYNASNGPLQSIHIAPEYSLAIYQSRLPLDPNAAIPNCIQATPTSLTGGYALAACAKCVNGTYKYDAPLKESLVTPVAPPIVVPLGTVAASAAGGLSAKLSEIFGITITVTITGTVNLSDVQTIKDYIQKRHKYKCVNNQWIYAGTEKRFRRDVEHVYNPWWAWVVSYADGRPATMTGKYTEKGTWGPWTGA
jgi:hypothetical protein